MSGVWIISRIFFITLRYSAQWHLSSKWFVFSHREPPLPPVLYFASCNLCRSYNSTNSDFYFYPESKWLSILFYLEAHFGFKAYWHYVRTIRSNCGAIRDSGTANRRHPKLRRVFKVLDVPAPSAAPWGWSAESFAQQTIERMPRSMKAIYSRILITRQPTPGDLSRDLYTAFAESNLRLIRSTFRRSRCIAVC